MDVLRHWVAYYTRDGVAPIVVTDETEVERRRADGWRVEGPFALEPPGAVARAEKAEARVTELLEAEGQAWRDAQMWQDRALESGWGQ